MLGGYIPTPSTNNLLSVLVPYVYACSSCNPFYINTGYEVVMIEQGNFLISSVTEFFNRDTKSPKF